MGRYRLNTTHLSWVGLVNPPNIYIYINKKKQKSKKFQKSFQFFFLIFSCIFIPILININLYFYTINIQIRYENTPFSLKCCKKLYRKKWIFFLFGQVSKKYKNFHIKFSYKTKIKKICLSMHLDFNNQLIKVVRTRLIFQKFQKKYFVFF